MKTNNEITLQIIGDIEEFKVNLLNNGYKNIEHFILFDTFMIPEKLKFEQMTTREIISKAIIIRKVKDITQNEIRQDISFKMKNINEIGEILEQKSIRMKVYDCEEAKQFMKVIGYKEIMNIEEEDYGYQKESFILSTKDIKFGDKLVEVEIQNENNDFNTIEKLKYKLQEEQFKLDFSNCFIKKAERELNKILKRSYE